MWHQAIYFIFLPSFFNLFVLYNLDDNLTAEIEQMVQHRDSLTVAKFQIMQVDSLAADTIVVPAESYLEQLYKRKKRIEAAKNKRDSTIMVESGGD